MKHPKPSPPDTVSTAAFCNLLATVQSQHETIRALLDKVRGLEAGEGWKVSASSPFTNSITFDTSVSRLPE